MRLGDGKEEVGGVDRGNKKSGKAGGGSGGGVGDGGAKTPKYKGKNVIDVPYDSQGRIKEEDMRVAKNGRTRQGKIKGIRDKRDKKGTGHGRKKREVNVDDE